MTAVLGFMFRNWQATLVVAAVVSFGGYVTYLRGEVAEARENAVTAGLRADSAEAAADTTRRRFVAALKANRDFWEKRVVQVEMERDATDRELARTTAVLARTRTTVDSLVVTAATDSVTVDAVDVRSAEFEVRRVPFTVWARANLPPPAAPAPPTLELRILVDPIDMDFRIGCEPGPGEIRRATLGVEVPEWATPRIGEVRQEPRVCNPQVAVPGPSWWERNDQWVGLGAGALGALIVTGEIELPF